MRFVHVHLLFCSQAWQLIHRLWMLSAFLLWWLLSTHRLTFCLLAIIISKLYHAQADANHLPRKISRRCTLLWHHRQRWSGSHQRICSFFFYRAKPYDGWCARRFKIMSYACPPFNLRPISKPSETQHYIGREINDDTDQFIWNHFTVILLSECS